MADEKWMTIEETARYLQLGKTALYDLAREGDASIEQSR
jgi:excisionase family DNA binding protein